MKPISFSTIVTILFLFLSGSSFSQETKSPECMFKSSLHYTVRGMSYWYDKENGGLEKITGVSYESLACQNCHVASCDMCHKTEIDGKAVYSSEVAKNQNMCLKCHARETAIMKINQKENTEDVHFAAGMKCMDCHTAREMHGDGVKYTSMKQEGVMDVTCEECHDNIGKTTSHTIHGNKLDCKSCHVSQVVSCTNCHFETMVKEGKRVAVPVSGWEFLMNYNGKVTSANMQTFVVPGDKTFMIFAPQYSHSVTKDGKKCEECHANTSAKKVEEGTIDLTWLKDGKVDNVKGVIPVVDGVKYNSVFENFENGSWTPISNPEYPVIQYVGFGTPLTKEQLSKLLILQNSSDNK
ncbi:hypothetical protein LJE82_09060 [bacterium BMS3Abin03]|nr:hypothetical protein [bacterium BMS3Abin03]